MRLGLPGQEEQIEDHPADVLDVALYHRPALLDPLRFLLFQPGVQQIGTAVQAGQQTLEHV